MKSFACGDVVPGCTKTFEAETEEAILAHVARHAVEEHSMPRVPAHVAAAVRAKIQDQL